MNYRYFRLHPCYNLKSTREMSVDGTYKVDVEFNKDTQEWEIMLTECE
jgi:hypothetical protein